MKQETKKSKLSLIVLISTLALIIVSIGYAAFINIGDTSGSNVIIPGNLTVGDKLFINGTEIWKETSCIVDATGSGDFTNVTDCNNAISSGVIFIRKGTYEEAVKFKSNITYIGEGWSNSILKCLSTTLDNGTCFDRAVSSTENIIIQNLGFDCNNKALRCIRLSGTKNALFQYNKVYNISKVTSVKVLQFSGGEGALSTNNYNKILNNLFDGSTSNTTAAPRMELGNGKGYLFQGNTLLGVAVDFAFTKSSTISNNQFFNTLRRAVFIQASIDATVSGNTFNGTQGECIAISRSEFNISIFPAQNIRPNVNNNICYKAQGDRAIEFADVQYGKLTGNIIVDPEIQAIRFLITNETLNVTGNKIDGNIIIFEDVTPSQDIISIHEVVDINNQVITDSSISNNIIISNTDSVYCISNTSQDVSDNLTIMGNLLVGCKDPKINVGGNNLITGNLNHITNDYDGQNLEDIINLTATSIFVSNIPGELNIGNISSPTIRQVSDQSMTISYNMNNGSVGTLVYDGSSHNQHAENNGATYEETGGIQSSGAFNCDGTNDYLNITDISDYDVNKGTFEFWMISDSWNSGVEENYFSTFFDGNEWTEIQKSNGNILRLQYQGSATTAQISISSLTKSIYHHFILTYDFDIDEYKIYIDGELEDEDTTALTFKRVGTFGTLCSGYDLTNFANTTIDSFNYFNRVLDSQEIKTKFLQRKENENSYVSQKDVTVDGSGETSIIIISGDGVGKVACIKADANLGTCTNATAADGTCNCA